MPKCKYFADNGQPSVLYDTLFRFYKAQGLSDRKAETAAVSSWLATRTGNFKDFAGKWNEDTADGKTVTLDHNGEPEIMILGVSPFIRELSKDSNDYWMYDSGWGFTTDFSNIQGYEFGAFANVRNPKLVEITDKTTRDEVAQITVNTFRNFDNDAVIFTKTLPSGEVLKHYQFKSFDQIQPIIKPRGLPNTSFDQTVDRIALQDLRDEQRDAKPVASYMLAKDDAFRLLQSITKQGEESTAKLARAVLIKANKSIPVVIVPGTGIAYRNEQIEVGESLSLNRDRFNTYLLTAVMEGYIQQLMKTDPAANGAFSNIYRAGVRSMKAKNIQSPHLASVSSFIHGLFTDRGFFQAASDTFLPSSDITIGAGFLFHTSTLFDFKRSYNDMLSDTIQRSAIIHERSASELFQEDAPAGEEVESKQPEIEKVGTTAPFSHLLTGDAIIDKYIAATFEKIQGIKSRINKRGKQTQTVRLKAEMAKYQKELSELVEQQNIVILIDVGQREIMRSKNALANDLSHKELGENLKLMDAWRDFSSFVDTNNADPNTLYQVRQISQSALELYNSYKELYVNSVKSAMADEGVPVRYLDQISPDKVIEDIGKSTASFIGLSFAESGLEIGADFIIRQAAYNINQDLISFESRLKEKLDKLDSKDLSFMFRKDEKGKFRPLTKYKKELYDKVQELQFLGRSFIRENKEIFEQARQLRRERAAASRAGDKASMERLDAEFNAVQEQIKELKRQNSTYDTLNEFMRQNFTYELSETGKQEHEDFLEAFKEGYYDYNTDTGQMQFNELAYRRDIEEYNPDKLKKWLETGEGYPRFASQFFTITPKDQWLDSSEFGKLSSAQKDFYDFFVSEYLSAQANVPMDYSFTDYNADRLLMEFSFMESETMDKFKYIGKEVKDFMKDLATVKYFERQVSTDQTAPLSGQQVTMVRFKPVSDFIKGTDGYWKEGEELPESLQKGLNEGRYKYKDGYLVISSAGTQNEKMVEKIVTVNDDPLSIFHNFKKFSLAYKYKREVEDVLNGIKELAYATPKELEKNKGMVNMLGQQIGSKTGSNLEARLNYTIEAFLTGNLKDTLPGTQKAQPGERAWSGGQMLESLNNLTRARQLGLNVASGVTNLSMGAVNNFIYAGRDEFYNESHLRSSYAIIKDAIASFYSGGTVRVGQSEKIMLMMQKLNMLNQLQEQFYTDNKWLTKAFEKLYVLQQGGEYINQGATMIAALLAKKVKVGEGEVSLWEAFDVKDGILVAKYPEMEYAQAQQIFILSEGIKKMNREIHGDYDPLNPMLAKKQIWGRVGMLFRTWMPQAIKTRTGKRYRDYQLSEFAGRDVFREGRWRTFGRTMFSDGSVGDKFANIGKFMVAVTISTISNRAGRKVISSLNADESDRANLNAMMKEVWWLMALTVATRSMLGMLQSDDDDDDKDPVLSSWLKYFYNQSARLDTELWFFYNPISFSKIVRDAVPLWSTMKQAIRVADAGKNFIFDNESDTYQRGFRKGDSKFWTQLQLFFPIVRQYQSLWSMGSQIYSDKYY